MQNLEKRHINVCPLALGVVRSQKWILKHQKTSSNSGGWPSQKLCATFLGPFLWLQLLSELGSASQQVSVIPARSQDRQVASTGSILQAINASSIHTFGACTMPTTMGWGGGGGESVFCVGFCGC